MPIRIDDDLPVKKTLEDEIYLSWEREGRTART